MSVHWEIPQSLHSFGCPGIDSLASQSRRLTSAPGLSRPFELLQPSRQIFVQTLAVAHRNFESAVIGRDHQHLARAVQQGGAAAAMAQVVLDFRPQFCVNRLVEEVG